MTAEKNKELARTLFQMFEAGELSRLSEYIHEDFVGHSPGFPDAYGVEGQQEYVSVFRSAFPDLRFEILDLIAEEDCVVVHFKWSGTHQGELLGIPPTGRRVLVEDMVLLRFRDGKVIESYDIQDSLDMLRQLGVEVGTRVSEATA
jgi:predicted ester cyclase